MSVLITSTEPFGSRATVTHILYEFGLYWQFILEVQPWGQKAG